MVRLCVVMLLFATTSCRVMYQPPMQNVPMFTKKGELQATAAWRNYQLAYTPSNSLAITLNAYERDSRKLDVIPNAVEHIYNTKARSVDGAFGYYKVNNKSSFDVFGGYGFGYASIISYYDGHPEDKDGGRSNYHKFYVQPGYVFGAADKKIRVALTTRWTIVNFYDFRDSDNYQLPGRRPLFIENAVTFRQKREYLSMLLQLQLSSALQSIDMGSYRPFTSIGLIKLAVTLNVDELFPKVDGRR